MRNTAFTIEFETNKIHNKNLKSEEAYKYQAVINTLSKSFNLFKVSRIRRITAEGEITLSASYYLTSHPLHNKKDDTWKDPITLRSNEFLQVLGNTIERHLTNSSNIAC